MNYDKIKIEQRRTIYLAFVREARPLKQLKFKWWLVMVANSRVQLDERLAELNLTPS